MRPSRLSALAIPDVAGREWDNAEIHGDGLYWGRNCTGRRRCCAARLRNCSRRSS